MKSHKLDYKIYGDDMQFAEVKLGSSPLMV